MNADKAIDRREFIKEVIKWAAMGTVGATMLSTTSDIIRRHPFPRILPQRIPRSIGDTGTTIPRPWYHVLPRVSINSDPLDRIQIESFPMTDTDCKKYCKANPGFLIETTKYGVSMPRAFEILEKDFDAKPGKLRAIATDWYAVIPLEPENTFFSASKDNIPEDYWHGNGLKEAKKAKLTPYGMSIPYGSESKFAWKDLVDINHIITTDREVEPGSYFIGPDQKIISAENKDVGMALDNLVLEIDGKKVNYDELKKYAENNLVEYRGKELPSIKLENLFELARSDYDNKALILHANNYPVSIPPWRQDDLIVLFDNKYVAKYGTPTKLIGGRFLSKAARIGGFYKIETRTMNA